MTRSIKNTGEYNEHVDLHKKRRSGMAFGFLEGNRRQNVRQSFDGFVEDATCNLGVADWKGREAIRENLRAFIDTGFTALHDVTEYWDGGSLKVFRDIVTMTPDDTSKPVVKPVMTHFFYMDEADPTKVRHWFGSVGPIQF